MTPTRLRQIATQLYRPARASDYAFRTLLAADLGKSVSTVKSWLLPATSASHRSMPAEINWVLERAARHADQLQLWDRPAEAVAGLIYQRLDALQYTKETSTMPRYDHSLINTQTYKGITLVTGPTACGKTNFIRQRYPNALIVEDLARCSPGAFRQLRAAGGQLVIEAESVEAAKRIADHLTQEI